VLAFWRVPRIRRVREIGRCEATITSAPQPNSAPISTVRCKSG
jgi:hypothetical protein